MTLPFRGAVTAKSTEGFCKDLTVGSSVRGGSREKIKIHIVCEMKKSTTCEHKRQKEKKGAVKQHTGRLKKGGKKRGKK